MGHSVVKAARPGMIANTFARRRRPIRGPNAQGVGHIPLRAGEHSYDLGRACARTLKYRISQDFWQADARAVASPDRLRGEGPRVGPRRPQPTSWARSAHAGAPGNAVEGKAPSLVRVAHPAPGPARAKKLCRYRPWPPCCTLISANLVRARSNLSLNNHIASRISR